MYEYFYCIGLHSIYLSRFNIIQYPKLSQRLYAMKYYRNIICVNMELASDATETLSVAIIRVVVKSVEASRWQHTLQSRVTHHRNS
jgi:hypothetical protein